MSTEVQAPTAHNSQKAVNVASQITVDSQQNSIGSITARKFITHNQTIIHPPPGQDVSNEVEKCLNDLFLTDPADKIEMIEHSNGKLLDGSGSWLHSNATFREWRDCHESRALWLYGDPGKGKTMLAIATVRSISETIGTDESMPDVLLVYFFCDNKDNRCNSIIAILRSLTYQILRARPDLYSYFRTWYRREGGQLFQSPSALQVLWRTLRNIFAASTLERIYIVIDALDELEEESVQDLLKLVGPYLDSDRETAVDRLQRKQEGACEVKWLLTSRNIHPIWCILQQTLRISLEQNAGHVQDAIRKFIDVRVHELQQRKGYDSALAQLVRNTLWEKSEGTFLYVSMACHELAQPSVRRINTKDILKKLPRGLRPLYERILHQITMIEDAILVGYATAILRSMVLAVRPLTMHELALAAGLPEEHRSDTDMLEDYAALCGSFICRRQDTVHFVHESVREYLHSIDEIFSRPSQQYHAALTKSFISNINDSLGVEVTAEQGLTLSYPSLFWMYHARQSGSYLSWESNLSSDFFLLNPESRRKWLEFFWAANHQVWEKKPEKLTPLHIAAYGGICSLARALVNHGHHIEDADSNGFTALIWAAQTGHRDLVELFVDLGADYEAKTNDGLTAIAWASINGHYLVVEKLIQSGASVRVADKRGWTALHYAAANGNIKTLGALLQAGAEIDAKDISQQTALQRAAFCAEFDIIKLLIKKKASMQVKDKDGLTLLHLAARDGHLDLVAFWLKHTADLETVDGQGWTPLMHAAWFGHPRVAAHLIQNQARIGARAFDGNTSLHLATWNRHIDVVKVLLEGKDDPNHACNQGETPLQQAAWNGDLAVCQLLLESGADPNRASHAGITPLHQAAANGHEAVAKLLIHWGGDPNAVDLFKQTPAQRAEENNHFALAKHLKSLTTHGNDDELEAEQDLSPGKYEPLDPAVCELLNIPLGSGFARVHGKQGFSQPFKVKVLTNGKTNHYFMKSGPDGDMFEAEHVALRALHGAVPSICPYSYGHGQFSNSAGHFVLMEYLHISNDSSSSRSGSGLSLAQKLAQLHSTPAPVPPGYQQPMFGWPRPTYCGPTKQTNTFRASWAKFYAENRLLAILDMIDEHHGTDHELRESVETIVRHVVPRLLRSGHLGGRRGIQPVLVHGDLWIGNRAQGTSAGWSGPEEVVYDPSACYAHSEYEIGIMLMFGGFSAGFFHEYHRLVPKTEPKEEYDDRIKLYQLYHYLNHYLIFRGGYKEDAMDVIKALTVKYC